LDLSSNPITDDGCQSLKNLLTSDKNLKTLDLNHNYRLTHLGVETMLSAIPGKKNISTINLSHCQLDLNDRNGRKILGYLQQNCSLTLLNLHSNEMIGQEFGKNMKHELDMNQKIQDIIVPSIIERGLKRKKYT